MAISQLISVNFNLRSPKAKTVTPLYMVVYYLSSEGKAIQAKIPTGKKILPTLWDSKRQQPIMISKGIDLTNKQLQEQAELTAYIAQARILVYQNNFSTFDEIKESITQQSSNNDMSPVTNQFIKSTRTAKATKLISEALASYTKDRKIKETSAKQYQKLTKVFCQWIVETNQRDSAKALSQSAFNAFVEWLKSNSNPSKVNKVASVIRQIIKYIAGTQAGTKNGITPVTFVNVKQVKEEKKCELLAEEIEAFKAIEVKNNKEQYYKDIFLLQLATGQRISDTLKLIKGDYKVQEGTPYNTIILTTIKRNTTSYIAETKEVMELLQAIRANKENEVKNEKDTSLAYYLKKFFTRAKLTRKVPSGKPLNKVISSHFARHTFVTIKLREGYTYEQVGKMIGDSALMIEKVYGHPTDTDIINSLQLQPAGNTPAQAASNTTAVQAVQPAAAPAVAKDKDLDYYNDLSDDDKLLYTKKLNDYNVLKDDFFNQLERKADKKRKAAAEAKTREILQVWGFEDANNMNYKKLCFLLDLIKHDINDFILTYKVYNEKAPQGSISALNDFERLIINIGKLAHYCHL